MEFHKQKVIFRSISIERIESENCYSNCDKQQRQLQPYLNKIAIIFSEFLESTTHLRL